MKVAGIGLPKTGTTSLAKAFQILGLDAKHCPFSFEEAIQYEMSVDSVLCLRYPELYYMFPECKFVLTVRRMEDWLRSSAHNYSNPASNDNMELIRHRTFGSKFYEEWRWRRVYENHYRQVHEFFALRNSDRLIEYDLCDRRRGHRSQWGPLCELVGKPVPDLPFPEENMRFQPVATSDLN